MQVIIYLQDNGIPAVMAPCLDSGLTVHQIAAKDVPTGKPYKICEHTDLPQDVPQEYWVIDPSSLTDGVGA